MVAMLYFLYTKRRATMTNGSAVKTLPYASTPHVMQLIQRYRSKGLPKPLSKADVEAMNIPSSSAFRALQTLKWLGLIDDGGYPTERFDQLKRASDSEFGPLFSGIVKEAYSGIFQYIDPDEADADAIESAFRKYDPVSERNRMINLFLGLCVEAGLVSEEKRPKTKASRTPRSAAQPRRPTERKTEEKVNYGAVREERPLTREEPLRRNSNIDDIPDHYRLLVELLRRLPQNQEWSSAQRRKWLGAISAAVDVVVGVIDEDESTPTEPLGTSSFEDGASWR
jgi:hypothetical protein